MKIQDAWIDDPMLRGLKQSPKLCVQVDVPPDQTIAEQSFDDGWTVSRYGPFVKYRLGRRKVTAGDFNARFTSVHNPPKLGEPRLRSIVDVSVFFGKSEGYTNEFALLLDRSRGLMKKYQPQWRLMLDDKLAQSGKILWLPIERHPVCKFWDKEHKTICSKRMEQVVRSDGVEFPLCHEHLEIFNHSQAAGRAS